jgi:hypothetical protein
LAVSEFRLCNPSSHEQYCTGVKPFFLHLLPPHLAHLCPIRALAEWLMVSGITEGYLFRKMASGDRVSEQNSHMVSPCTFSVCARKLITLFYRLVISFWNSSRTICWTSALIPTHTAHTPFEEVGVNGSIRLVVGGFVASAIGGAGALSSAT